MSNFPLDFEPLSSKIKEAKDILVLLPVNPRFDQVAGGLSLYLSLKKMGKNVLIGCSTPMTVAFNRLVGVDKITSQIGNRNLVISFDYVKEAVEKASYNIEDNKLKIIVEPKPGNPPIDFKQVSFSYSGVVADIILIIGASRLEDLGEIYNQEKQVFNESVTVNIDAGGKNTNFGKINLVDNQASSCSEVVGFLIKKLDLPLDEDIATNLYLGIKEGSGNFESEKVRAETFEIAGWCIKKGAKKFIGQKISFSTEGGSLPFSSSSVSEQKPFVSLKNEQPLSQSLSSPKDLFMAQTQANISGQSQPATPGENKSLNPPPDWFKPKIFKGRTSV